MVQRTKEDTYQTLLLPQTLSLSETPALKHSPQGHCLSQPELAPASHHSERAAAYPSHLPGTLPAVYG
jgi:hypothetical protein